MKILCLYLIFFRGFANFLMASSGVAFTQSSKDFLSPYLSENYKDLYLLKSFAYGYGILLTSCKLTEIFIQYSNELSVNL